MDMPSKDGWTHERDHDKVTLGRKQYRNMQEWSRPCAICGEKFTIHVRASDDVVNSSFGLRTCKNHRGQKIGGGVVVATDEALRAAYLKLEETHSMLVERWEGLQPLYDELQQFYGVQLKEIAELKRENADLRTRLSRYELGPRLAAIQTTPQPIVLEGVGGLSLDDPETVPASPLTKRAPWD
jgi:hypothetical protein